MPGKGVESVREMNVKIGGVQATAVLLSEAAPKTSDLLWDLLPREAGVRQSIACGELVYFPLLPGELSFEAQKRYLAMGEENLVQFMPPGTIGFYAPDRELVFSYGQVMLQTMARRIQANLVARVVENLDGYLKACAAVRWNGETPVVLQRK